MVVLRALIDEFVRTGQAVGSGTIARRGDCDVSPATIRKVLNDMNAGDAMELLKDKVKKTQSNAEFLLGLNLA